MKDVIIVLAGGVNPDGTLPEIPKKRVETGVDLFNKNKANKIIMSGAYGFWLDWKGQVPNKNEATAMREYAISLGIPENSIITEEKSKDTLGNAYFTKVDILEKNGWHNIVVVTSDFHMLRTKHIFDFVLGQEYEIEYVSSESNLSKEEKDKWAKSEENTIKISNKIVDIDSISKGDTEAIKNILFSVHPGYAENPKVSFEKLEKILGRSTERF